VRIDQVENLLEVWNSFNFISCLKVLFLVFQELLENYVTITDYETLESFQNGIEKLFIAKFELLKCLLDLLE
jgi:hypothetical protein